MTNEVRLTSDSLSQMAQLNADIALEGIGLLDVGNRIVSKFSQLTNALSNVTKPAIDVIEKLGFTKEPMRSTTRLPKVLENHSYLELADIEIPVIDGLSVDWITYSEHLLAMQDVCSKLLPDVLTPAQSVFGGYLNNPSSINNASDLNSVKLFDLESIRKNNSAYLEGSRAKTKFGDVLPSVGHFKKLSENLNRLNQVEQTYGKEDILAAMDNLEIQIDKLLAVLDGDSNIRISGSTMKKLSNIVYGVAEHVTLYAIFKTQQVAFSKSVDNAIEALTKAKK